MRSEQAILHTVAWAAIRGRRILAVRTVGRDAFYLPGGKPHPGESPEQALHREVLEELGIVLDLRTLRPFATFTGPAHGLGRPVTLHMAVFTGEGLGEPHPSREVGEFAWLVSAERDRCAPVAADVLDRCRHEDLID